MVKMMMSLLCILKIATVVLRVHDTLTLSMIMIMSSFNNIALSKRTNNSESISSVGV